MSFRDFTLQQVELDLGLCVESSHSLFADVTPVQVSESVARFLDLVRPLGLVMPTEKARSELLVAPLLAEVWHRMGRQLGLFSGVQLDADVPRGLVGTVDFLLTRSPQLYYVEPPVLAVVDVQPNNVTDGLGHCAAEMVAAQRFNQHAGMPQDVIFGCVTTGANWRFLALQDRTLAIDLGEFHISQPAMLLGIWLEIVGD